jgi:hypothetical protein
MPWTPETIGLLTELWPQPKMSAAMIGREIEMTRNAVIGKAHRLGLSPKRASPKTAGRKKRVRKVPLKKTVHREAPIVVPAVEPVAGGIHILDLKEEHCRAVVGYGPDLLARYCGATKRIMGHKNGGVIYDGSWCDAHARLYVRDDPRR